MTQRLRVAYLMLSSFEGYGGTHWYARIKYPDASRDIDIRTALDRTRAEALNKRDRPEPNARYVAGRKSGRYLSRVDAISAAIESFDRERCDVLVLGSPCEEPAKDVLWSRDVDFGRRLRGIAERAKEIYAASEGVGGVKDPWRHGFNTEMEALADAWIELINASARD